MSTAVRDRFDKARTRTGEGNQARAAKLLGLRATTLNSKIKLFNIEYEVAVHVTGLKGISAPGRRPIETPGLLRS